MTYSRSLALSRSFKLLGCSFNIDAFFVEEYHQRLKAMFSEFAQQADDLSTQEILVLGIARNNLPFFFFFFFYYFYFFYCYYLVHALCFLHVLQWSGSTSRTSPR